MARQFCTVVGSDASKLITRAWIEKFKLKNGISPRAGLKVGSKSGSKPGLKASPKVGTKAGPGRLLRRASETALPDSTRYKNQPILLSASNTTGTVSPASPTTKDSPLLSAVGNGLRSSLSISMDFESVDPKQSHPQSASAINSAVTDPACGDFSGISPTSVFTFSPEPNSGYFNPLSADPNLFRPRSQTVPNIDPLDYLGQSQNLDSVTPKLTNTATCPSSAMGSPVHETTVNPFTFDSAISTPVLRHTSSNSSLAGRSTASGAVSVTPVSGPNSPTQDDARRAADTLLSYISSMANPGLVDQQEYDAVVRLTDKLRLQQQQQQQQQQHPHILPQQGMLGKMNLSSGQGLGILSRIPEGDAEMMHSPSHHL
ncbi:hypothetical protein Micbo1qcDRAFT_8418 [Microdochium bolleyi]|uniref:HTH CENPB-type domain-containing protein n=1 Tax=Microdochium bolleyi TaxID=196109 RepID=A0A136JK66_9PEZI|nr:hypothetical protein Micbo1qcDRAFT_8418 [Microdochium bolleyi]